LQFSEAPLSSCALTRSFCKNCVFVRARVKNAPRCVKEPKSSMICHTRNISSALKILKAQPNERLLASWRYKYGEQVIFEMPRLAVIRAMALNHMIHHRGQLSVYLRLLGIALPHVYGPTADESTT